MSVTSYDVQVQVEKGSSKDVVNLLALQAAFS